MLLYSEYGSIYVKALAKEGFFDKDHDESTVLIKASEDVRGLYALYFKDIYEHRWKMKSKTMELPSIFEDSKLNPLTDLTRGFILGAPKATRDLPERALKAILDRKYCKPKWPSNINLETLLKNKRFWMDSSNDVGRDITQRNKDKNLIEIKPKSDSPDKFKRKTVNRVSIANQDDVKQKAKEFNEERKFDVGSKTPPKSREKRRRSKSKEGAHLKKSKNKI